MASWRDQLRAGSFRGAGFLIRDASGAGGRRAAVHEFPGRDKPYPEDLGRKKESFSLECFVLGDGYMADRDALLTALRQAGRGTLVHPYWGEMTVLCLDWSIRESAAEGGMAVVSLQLVEAGPVATPTAASDTGAASGAAADAAQAAAQDRVAAVVTIYGPSYVLSAAGAVVARVGGAIREAARGLTGAGAVLTGLTGDLASLQGDVQQLLAAPSDLAAEVIGLVQGVAALAATPGDALSAMTGLIGFGSDLPQVTAQTASRRTQAANQTAVVDLVRVVAAAEAVRAAAQVTFSSYEDAVATRDALSDRIDGLALAAADAGDDDGWRTCEDLRLALVRDITARGGSLARLYAYTPMRTEPALVIAHRLYGDATRADEIVARNRVLHPGFVAGGVALQVLTDA